jgi:dTDP-4-dehydrorhamnose reductase
MLGSAIVPIFPAAGHKLIATDSAPRSPQVSWLDVRDQRAIDEEFVRWQPELVLHLAAETDVDRCEREPEHAWRTNAVGTYYVVLACQRHDIPLVYISTAGVFDGNKESPYIELDEPQPINVYGASKREGERIVQQFLPRSFVVRAGWMIGGGERDKKFVRKIIDQIHGGTGILYAVTDKYGTPTYTLDFARGLVTLVTRGYFGLYHMACSGWATRLDVAQAILEFLGRTDITVQGVNSDFFAESYPAPRPRSEMMENWRLGLLGINQMRPWRVALQEYLELNFTRDGTDRVKVEVA